MAENNIGTDKHHGFTNAIVRIFLHSNLSLILMLIAAALGVTALFITPREEDPQIVVPMADVYVSFPGHGAEEVEQLVATPLEKLLYQIDGVEHVYSMSRDDQAIITVRFYVGEDRERSLVKIYKRIDEHIDIVPPGVTGWVVKPVEIDDVPFVTLTLASTRVDEYALRRVGEEVVERLAAVPDTSRAYVVGGQSRLVQVYLDPERLRAYSVSPLEVQRAIQATNITQTSGDYTRGDRLYRVEAGRAFQRPEELESLVVGVFNDRPVLLKDVATINDGPEEATSFVRHGWGPARGFAAHEGTPGTLIGPPAPTSGEKCLSRPAVTIALAKKKGTNAVWVAQDIIKTAEMLKAEVIPDDIEVVVTRNYGLTADEKVNELVEGLAVAIFIVIALLTLGLGWREALIVAVAVPVVFGLTLSVNLLAGYTINRVTLFALILSLGLLVDDPIVDVENITRHFALRGRATRQIVQEAVAEIRPPLITATLAVIVSFLPLFFITGMMGPYMRPMALNIPITMLMSMLVAFMITPWLTYHVLKRRYATGGHGEGEEDEAVRHGPLYRLFTPLMVPLLKSRRAAWAFLGVMGLLLLAAVGLAATRSVPLKMLPFDNKNELLLVLDFDEGTTLERSDAAVREIEEYLASVPEVTDFTSYVGLAAPMDFNGLVRHYYLRRGENVAEIRLNLVGKKNRHQNSHGLNLRIHDDLTAIAERHHAIVKVVETPPGPPVLATLVAEVYGRPDHAYTDLIASAKVVGERMRREPFVIEVDDVIEADSSKLIFVTDQEKAALNGVSVADIAQTLRIALGGHTAGLIQSSGERNPLRIELRLPEKLRSSPADLGRLHVKGRTGELVALAEIGHWEQQLVDQTIYHKDLERVVYVYGEIAGRPPAAVVVDILADQNSLARPSAATKGFGVQGSGFSEEDGKSSQTTGWPMALAVGDANWTVIFVSPAAEATGHPLRGKSAQAAKKSTVCNTEKTDLNDNGWVADVEPRSLAERTYLSNGSGIDWRVPAGIRVEFAGEGEWQITLDVFRDLGLAFAAALVAIYILLVGQTGSFAIPAVLMLAIPLTVIGVMPGFWLLNAIAGGQVGPYADPIFFTATGMIGMIALSGIVTRQAVIIIDFVHLSLRNGRSLYDAILESCVVRLRPILLTVGTAMLSAVPIALDPIFSGLAWALIFGLLASTVFTLFVIPVVYWLVYKNKPGHGLSQVNAESTIKVS